MFNFNSNSLDQLIAELNRIGLVIEVKPVFTTLVGRLERGGPGGRPPVSVAYSTELFYKESGDVVFQAPIAHPTFLEAVKYAANFVQSGELDDEEHAADLDPWEFMLAKCAEYRVKTGQKTSYDSWMIEICDVAVMSLQDVEDACENLNLDLMWAQDVDSITVAHGVVTMMKTPDHQDQADQQVDWTRAFC